MKNLSLTALLLMVFLTAGCSDKVTEEDLIGGKWSATAGFENEEPGGEPGCSNYAKGLEFKGKDIVYNEYDEENFKYHLNETDEGKRRIEFTYPGGWTDYYDIYKVSENAFGMIGPYRELKNSCYFERENN